MSIHTIVFDLGGVLIDWNPEYLYRKIYSDPAERAHFLENICTQEWNEQQDAGRPIQEAMEILIGQHPSYEEEIRAYYGRWSEMLGGAIEETVVILKHFIESKAHRVYALTNWSAETFPFARERFEFLGWFEGVVVSGEEKMKKPDPAIYRLLQQRFRIQPEHTLFIDDSRPNVEAASALGFQTIHFRCPQQLGLELRRQLGVPV
jgi:2-haloacid dehalogenase